MEVAAMVLSIFFLLFAIVYGVKCQIIFLTGEGLENCSQNTNVYVRYKSVEVDYDESTVGNKNCPPWFSRRVNGSGNCEEGPDLDGLIEQDMSTLQTRVMRCYCMTGDTNSLTVGICLHKCFTHLPYYPLPCHSFQLQNFSCLHHWKRRGPLCSRCVNGYGHPAYSYKSECVQCETTIFNWLKYITAAYIPLTFFYILVALFSINFIYPELSAVVFVIQMGSSPIVMRLINQYHTQGTTYRQVLMALATIGSIVNLDFGRTFYSFCLSPGTTATFITALDFGIVIFPLILIVITHQLVKLYDKNCKVIVLLTNVLIKPIRHRLRSSSSLIQVFASFLYLSSSRLLIASTTLLMPVRVYNYQLSSDGNMNLISKYVLFSDPTLEYLCKDHLPYAILALVMLTLFYIIPVILLFTYPFSWCQRALNRITCVNLLVLSTFVDVFQGYYKDGTDSTRDYRHFSGLLLFFQMIPYLVLTLTESTFFHFMVSFFLHLYLCTILIFKPYKQFSHNLVMSLMLTAVIVGIWSIIIQNWNRIFVDYTIISMFLLTVSLCLIFLCFLALTCKQIKALF